MNFSFEIRLWKCPAVVFTAIAYRNIEFDVCCFSLDGILKITFNTFSTDLCCGSQWLKNKSKVHNWKTKKDGNFPYISKLFCDFGLYPSLQSHPFNGRIAIRFIMQGVSLTLPIGIHFSRITQFYGISAIDLHVWYNSLDFHSICNYITWNGYNVQTLYCYGKFAWW